MQEPSEEEIREYMAETGHGYQFAKHMLMKAAPSESDDDSEGSGE